MKDIVEFIVKQFVSYPDAVEVSESEQDGYVNITLKVAPEDMGLTIGKSGQTIKAIRRLLTIKAIAENVRVNLELIDSGTTPEQTVQNDSENSEAGNSEAQKIGEPEIVSSDNVDQSDLSDSPSSSESSEKTDKTS